MMPIATRKLDIAVAVVVIAMVTVGAIVFHRSSAPDAAAKRTQGTAIRDATKAKAKLEALMRELDELDATYKALTRQLADPATTDEVRSKLEGELRTVNDEKRELRRPERVLDDGVAPATPGGA